jgi:polyphosphate kinase
MVKKKPPASRARAAAPARAKKPAAPRVSLDDPALYLNRELTWLAFDGRVLHEAEDERTPLLERVKFLAIAAANLDEFFMKRIGGLKQQVEAGVAKPTVDGRTPLQQIRECYAVVREMLPRMRELERRLRKLLKAEGIEILPYVRLAKEEAAAVRAEYLSAIFPLVTPQSVDPAHPFPFISNLSLNLLVTLRYPGEIGRASCRERVS